MHVKFFWIKSACKTNACYTHWQPLHVSVILFSIHKQNDQNYHSTQKIQERMQFNVISEIVH